jgi:hypothetical protein
MDFHGGPIIAAELARDRASHCARAGKHVKIVAGPGAGRIELVGAAADLLKQ